MSQFVRGFLAFEIEDLAIRRSLTETQMLAMQTGADLKPVEPGNIHMTIRFLGDITLDMANKVYAEMQKTLFKPFLVQLTGLGVFPSLSFPRVLWVGIAHGTDQLQNIFNQIEPRLQNLGFSPDHNGFSPHLTIARVRSARNKQLLADFVTKNARHDFGSFEIKCLRLKRSELTPKGPIYTTLKEYCPE